MTSSNPLLYSASKRRMTDRVTKKIATPRDRSRASQSLGTEYRSSVVTTVMSTLRNVTATASNKFESFYYAINTALSGRSRRRRMGHAIRPHTPKIIKKRITASQSQAKSSSDKSTPSDSSVVQWGVSSTSESETKKRLPLRAVDESTINAITDTEMILSDWVDEDEMNTEDPSKTEDAIRKLEQELNRLKRQLNYRKSLSGKFERPKKRLNGLSLSASHTQSKYAVSDSEPLIKLTEQEVSPLDPTSEIPPPPPLPTQDMLRQATLLVHCETSDSFPATVTQIPSTPSATRSQRMERLMKSTPGTPVPVMNQLLQEMKQVKLKKPNLELIETPTKAKADLSTRELLHQEIIQHALKAKFRAHFSGTSPASTEGDAYPIFEESEWE